MSIRILVVDDSRDLADAMSELLVLALPCAVDVSYNGIDALQKAQAMRPDVLILDLNMPGMSGVEVARRVCTHYQADPPYCIALTGDANAARDLDAIGAHFNRAFAKPLDVDQLVAVLGGLASGRAGAVGSRFPFDLAELFTRAARQVIPLATHLAFSFDYRGPGVVVNGDPVEVQCGVHRLLLGAVDMLSAGFVLFSADATLDSEGSCSVVIAAAGTGPLRPGPTVSNVLRRLRLDETTQPSTPGAAPFRAAGVCPNTNATVSFSSDPHEGLLLRMSLTYQGASEDGGSRSARAPGARVWVIHPVGLPAACLQRRMQRLGWHVTLFASCSDAVSHAVSATRSDAAPSPAPTLVVVVEGFKASIRDAEALRRSLPSTTRCVLAVMAGSARLGSLNVPPGYDLRVYPFSPMELAEFCELASPGGSASSDSTASAALGMRDRPVVLIVDDNEINRIVARGLAEALGYEVRTANDGLDAIDHCRQSPPHIVLMDLDMPVLGGIDATVRIRELQRLGQMAHFSIVAATADATAEAACERAGMDGYLTKPLRLSELREQLRRVSASI